MKPDGGARSRHLEGLRAEIRRRHQAGEGATAIARAMAVSKDMVYSAIREAEESIPEDCSWAEVSRRLLVLIRRLESEELGNS